MRFKKSFLIGWDFFKYFFGLFFKITLACSNYSCAAIKAAFMAYLAEPHAGVSQVGIKIIPPGVVIPPLIELMLFCAVFL